MMLLKFLFFVFVLSYVELIEAYDVTTSNFTSQWHLAIKTRLGLNVVQSRDRLIYVYFPMTPELKIRLETTNLSDACEILVESNSTVAARFSKDNIKSLGNGKVIVVMDIKSMDGLSKNKTFYVIDPDKCSYVIGANHNIKQRQNSWHVVTYQNTFDVFSINTDDCPTDRMCRNTYDDSGDLVGSSVLDLPGPFGTWTIHSVLKNDPSDGYFFSSMYYQPSRFFVVLRLNSKLEILQERRINATVKYAAGNRRVILHYTQEKGSEPRTMILDSRLIPLVEFSPPYPEHCLSLAYGYFTNDSMLEVFSCKNYKDNGIDWSSYIRLISIDGKVSQLVKFHDDAGRDVFRVFKLKDDLHCIVAMFGEEREFSFGGENQAHFITRCINSTKT